MRRRGFTLIELMLAVAIVALLAATATASYRDSVIRAELAQQLVDVGHLRRVLALDRRLGLEVGARPGAVPPLLAGQMSDSQFQALEGLQAQLVRWPNSTPARGSASPGLADYALVVQRPAAGGERRLMLYYREIEKAGFSRQQWLTAQAFVFALDPTPGGGTPVDPPPPPPSEPSEPVDPGKPECPPGWTAVGNSGHCKPPNGQPCPPGWEAVGNSGACRPLRPESARRLG